MSNINSFERFDYTIRPNKSVERKLIVESLALMGSTFSISHYRYIGFGATAFMDFRLVHRLLNITDMISIERAKNYKRAEFNRPHDCIVVEPGESTEVFPRLGLSEKKSVIWLDYDKSILGAPVLRDLQMILDTAPSGTFLLITLLLDLREILDECDPEDDPAASLRKGVGDLLNEEDLPQVWTAGSYRSVVYAVMKNAFQEGLKETGRNLLYVPIWHYEYADGAPMITLGGLLANRDEEARFSELQLFEQCPNVKGEEVVKIGVPPLTLRERQCLDRLLPAHEALTAEEVQEWLGFKIKPKHVEAYAKYYRYYPTFGEFVF